MAGAYAADEGPAFGENSLPFFWTPLTQFTVLAGNDTHEETLLLNDVDQFAGVTEPNSNCSFVWRPDLGMRMLATVNDKACIEPELAADHGFGPRAEQVRGTWVVGMCEITRQDSEGGTEYLFHAALWRVPPLNRAAYPTVNADPYGGVSATIRLSSGGCYYQLYRATQAAAAGPYVELVDRGDGTTSRRTRPSVGVITSQNHLYTKAGTYWVRVYVQDAQKRWGVAERKLTVTP